MTTPPLPDVRFHLPPGPPVKPATWRRRYRWLIRTASVVVAVGLVVGAVVALVAGYHHRSTITANGAVTVDCETRAAAGSVPVAYQDEVEIYDADAHGGPLARTRLDHLRRLGGGTCLAQFTVTDLETVEVYVVRIGRTFRALVTPAALESGYLFA